MKTLLLYMGILGAAYFLTITWKPDPRCHVIFSSVTQWIVYVLVLLMGMRLGSNPQVTENLASIGIQALVITICCVGGSIGAVFLLRKVFGINKLGETTGGEQKTACDETHSKNSDTSSNIKNALIILLLVILGALCGFLLKGSDKCTTYFNRHCGNLMTLSLCIMQACIGADLALSGKMSTYFRKLGLRIFAFPLAAVLGTLVLGAIAGTLFGFTLRESLAISAGFGWYSYAPAVIAGAGEEHLIASAVAFMYNVIRETSAIVLIPLFSRCFGCLEVTAMPGVSAMDICLPIIERSCRQDTIIYTFFTGLFMHVITSVGVPLIMAI